ncbi:arylamine N-acetyltransferase family protein [Streptomyces sp. bgisy031]|uniref:arylamine N-acetyltransferase family protein n=1 Tax=Streptomyces sp. bgisy031 TaxID=3413772 RepID=UPI003D7529AD
MNASRTDAYLRRIATPRPSAPTAQALRTLHLAHLRAVPFENLSIHLGEDITLDEEAIVTKLVDRHRGGFCYELNGGFAALLTALGFEVSLLQARVYGKEGHLGIPYDHLALRVRTADGADLLADVGFGAHSHFPLDLGERGEQGDPGGVFLVAGTNDGDLRVTKDGAPEYLLEQRPRELRDFEAGRWYNTTSPRSTFTRSLVCSLVTDEGRVTLSGRTLTTTVGGERHVTALTSDREALDTYRDSFGIELDRVPPDPAA